MNASIWTVFAVFADTEESYVTQVEASTAPDAWLRACREAPGVIKKAGVISGRFDDESDDASDVIDLSDHAHPVLVSTIHVSTRKIVIPHKCGNCKVELDRSRSVAQWDLVKRSWYGHLSADGDAVAAERDQSMMMHAGTVADAVKLKCAMCGRPLWDGTQGG